MEYCYLLLYRLLQLFFWNPRLIVEASCESPRHVAVGKAGRRPCMPKPPPPPSAITLFELRRSQGDASRRPPRCYQAISFACADSLTDLRLITQQDDESGDCDGGRGWPWWRRVTIGPLPSSSGGDPVLKA
jgi:hypothetical protein